MNIVEIYVGVYKENGEDISRFCWMGKTNSFNIVSAGP
jgi:hypothetical protein